MPFGFETADLATAPAEVSFTSPDRVGSVEFALSGGRVLADVFSTSADAGAFAPLDHACITADPDTAEAIGRAWLAWAACARAGRLTETLPQSRTRPPGAVPSVPVPTPETDR